MTERAVMRFSERTFELDRQIEDHVKSCGVCSVAGSRPSAWMKLAMDGGACLTGALLFQEWKANYEALHSEEERAALDVFAEKNGTDFVAKAIKAAGQKRGGDA